MEEEEDKKPFLEEEDKKPFLEEEAEDSVPLQYPGRRRTPRASARSRSRKTAWKTRIALLSVACLAVLLLVVGSFVGGVFVGKTIVHNEAGGSSSCPKCNHSVPSSGNGSAHDMTYNWGANVSVGGESVRVVDWLDANMTADNMMKNLMNLTAKPHIAGSVENMQLAEMIYDQWKGYGVAFDEVKLVNYSVLLSYPDPNKPNLLQLLNSSQGIEFNADTSMEPPLTPGENDSTVVPPFNAYSGDGNATGLLVYVNFGTIDDFLYLTENLSLSLDGYICIARYGNIFRGDKAKLAQQFGCVGLIIYSDPEQYAPMDGPPVYPDGPSLPEGGVQRGSLLIPDGDPLTPGIPAIPGVYRRNYSEVIAQKGAPAIPVQPISYYDAMQFMSQLNKYEAPPSWQGQLNLTYNVQQVEENYTFVTYIEVNNIQVEKVIYDVTATIYGGVEPDRTVILGNHRDAWVFGAVDPNSGTAALIEIARAFSVLRSYDWRPGRTIVLCSWDAEEFGLMGATEWVEDNAKLLGDSTVAYLNVDSGVSGSQYLTAAANPLLYEVLFQAAQMVKCPNPGFDTVYDEWLNYTSENYNGTTKPRIADLGSGSDFTMFLQQLGISCTSTSYSNSTGYAVYHSVHDNFYWMKHFGDPDFSHHLASGLVWVKTGILLATTPVLPYDPRDYAIALTRIHDGLVQQYGTVLRQQNITLDYLSSSVTDFTQASLALWDEIQQAMAANLTQHENVIRIINNKLMNIERAFIHPEGLPGRPLFKHVVFAPSSVNTYAGSVFPGISDSIFNATQYGGDWNEVRKQIDVVRISIRYATQIMNQPTLKYVPKMHM